MLAMLSTTMAFIDTREVYKRNNAQKKRKVNRRTRDVCTTPVLQWRSVMNGFGFQFESNKKTEKIRRETAKNKIIGAKQTDIGNCRGVTAQTHSWFSFSVFCLFLFALRCVARTFRPNILYKYFVMLSFSAFPFWYWFIKSCTQLPLFAHCSFHSFRFERHCSVRWTNWLLLRGCDMAHSNRVR